MKLYIVNAILIVSSTEILFDGAVQGLIEVLSSNDHEGKTSSANFEVTRSVGILQLATKVQAHMKASFKGDETSFPTHLTELLSFIEAYAFSHLRFRSGHWPNLIRTIYHWSLIDFFHLFLQRISYQSPENLFSGIRDWGTEESLVHLTFDPRALKKLKEWNWESWRDLILDVQRRPGQAQRSQRPLQTRSYLQRLHPIWSAQRPAQQSLEYAMGIQRETSGFNCPGRA